MSNNPYAFNTNDITAQERPVANVSVLQPLIEISGLMTAMSWGMIAYGCLMILTFWGILFCFIPIWAGIMLLKAAGNLKLARFSSDPNLLYSASRDLKTFFMIAAISMLVGVVMMALAMLFVIGAFGFAFLAR